MITCIWRSKNSWDLIRMQIAKSLYEFNRIKLFLQKVISWMALSFSCNWMRLSHVNSARIILCKFLAFNCTIFLNTNLVEIILPQSFEQIWSSGIWVFFMLNWMNAIIERIRSRGMVKRECSYQIYCACVTCKKLCDCHFSFFFFSFFPSRHFFWADWHKLFSKFCPIVALSACDQDRS